ncbi:MAG: universal stress protein [Acidimicrobiales bacterium]
MAQARPAPRAASDLKSTGIERSAVFHRIIAGFDGSEDSRRALRVALELADQVDGEVTVISVVRPLPYLETDDESDEAAAAELASARLGLDDLRSEAARLGVTMTEAVVTSTDVAAGLANYSEEHGFDLLVVGRHGREQVAHGGVGRSLEKLLRQHPCPVLVV